MKNGFSRRQFMQLAGAGGLQALLAGTSFSRVEASPKSKRIIVIGAGISGLTAANALAKLGYLVTVLEGRSRIGGRIQTDRTFATGTVELGASWIHTSRGNPLTPVAKKYKITSLPTNYDSYALYDNSGAVVDPSKFAIYDTLYSQQLMDAVSYQSGLGQDRSMATALGFASQDFPVDPTQQTALNWKYASNIVGEYGCDLDQLSLRAFDSDLAYREPDLYITNGYDTLANALAAGLSIQLNQIVTSVDYSNGVVVTTQTGQFKADACLVTLPLGVLKSGTVSFNPPLPDSKTQSISKLGMGLLNKVLLKFPFVFWPTDVQFLEHISDTFNDFPEWINQHYYTKAPVLIALVAGRFANNLENMSDADVTSAAMAFLKKAFGPSIPDPVSMQMTRWSTDPFSLGSYSYNAVNSTLDDNFELAQPVTNSLFFAGEATNERYPSTVHGAYLSGKREALRIRRLVR
ncbi:MAG: FAD-dependent oxidoreductase [Planctomycetota bacterium]